ncbi:unnamed protein product [Durusdinium trenchii]|uniref:Uncharacterized protein n=2 Tax=Durusdinium trenchii TaxID=1381693 RepID=A0ABP0I0X1_9DINO
MWRDELLWPCRRRLRAAAVAAAAVASDAAVSLVKEVHRVSSMPCGRKAATLLTCIWKHEDQSPPERYFLYLHGFPDQSLDHRIESSHYGQIHPRLPQRLAERLLSERPRSAFVAFNFAGTPGSDDTVSFYEKTVSREVLDALCIIEYLRRDKLWPIHVIGISTGAIVASLLRGKTTKLTITAIAGLVDLEKGLHYDFDESQLASFESDGFCWKEFWLPQSASNPGSACSPTEAVEGKTQDVWSKCAIPLSVTYRDDFLSLDLKGFVSQNSTPMLILHGDRDRNVPLENGEELFRVAAKPKEMVIIKGGDHLLRSSKCTNKAAAAILDFIARHDTQEP